MCKLVTLLGMACVVGISSVHAVTLPDVPPDIREMDKTLKSVIQRLDKVEEDLNKIKQIGKFQDLPISQAMLSRDEILNWSTESVLEISNYDYLNYQYVLKKIKPLFTKAGYESYLKALNDSKNLESVKSKKLIVSAVPTGEPFISKEGVNGEGVYKWEVQVPVMIIYKSETQLLKQQINMNLDVVRVTLGEARAGIAIHSITANTPGTPAPTEETKPEEAATPAPSASTVEPPSPTAPSVEPPSTGLVPPPAVSKP